ncbi:unnamed protein product, partial [Symbiodinium sp. CCMP2456]
AGFSFVIDHSGKLFKGKKCTLKDLWRNGERSDNPAPAAADDSDEDSSDESGDETLSSATSSISSHASLSSRDSIMSRLCAQISDVKLFQKDCEKASEVSESSSKKGFKFSPGKTTGYKFQGACPKVVPSYVLDRLPTTLAPAPVPLIAEQYQKALKAAGAQGEDGDDSDAVATDDEGKPKDAPPKKPAGYRFKVEPLKKDKASKPKATGSKNQKPSKAQAKGPKDAQHAYGEYLPKDFEKRAKQYRENAKAEGHAPKKALRMWIESKERASLLADLPLMELKRTESSWSSSPGKAHLRGASVDILNDPTTMDLLSLRWVIEQPDGSFLPEMPRFQKLFGTFEDLIDVITEKAGFMSRQQMSEFTCKTVVRHVDANGVKRHTGKPKELQKSQPLDSKYA